ncbi:zinc finger protein [Macleaya cordata]|uniref:Zinc finger protein n=1 Tax=Macleaya cordata TaxID=56857 RepID=A0A200QUL7_MACCD|nr:zinc finger protein [Macleaya cordata]
MKAIFETTGSRQVDIHYVNAGVPGVVEENFEGYYLGHDDLLLEEVLQDQESVYQSLQISGGGERAKASTSTGSDLNPEQSGGERSVPEKEGESSQVRDVQSQLALDEALAMTLQELENQLGGASLSETSGSGTETVNREVNATNTSVQAARQDNVDPDNMTYEQLQSLGEAIGTESKGLSDELIAYLPTFKYKTGFFSKKEKHEECVICYMEYKNREVLTTLPCQHQYHSKCVTRWLKLNKLCK